MVFFTADICDEYSDKASVLAPGYRNYGGAEKCQGEIITIKLDRNNSDLISLLRDEDGTGKVVVVDVDGAYYAVVGENLMKFAQPTSATPLKSGTFRLPCTHWIPAHANTSR